MANDTITAQVVAATRALEAAAKLALESPAAEAVSEPHRAELSDGPWQGAIRSVLVPGGCCPARGRVLPFALRRVGRVS